MIGTGAVCGVDFLSLILQKQRDEVGWIVGADEDDFGVDDGMILRARLLIVSLANGQGSIAPAPGMSLTRKEMILTL